MVEAPPPAPSKPPARRKSIRMSDGQLRAAVREAGKRLATRPEPQKPLVLIGLMGVGKTAVGKRLAQVLRTKFVDSDEEIERAAQRSISEIFELYGEAHFRNRERAIVERLLAESRGVISLGGGAFMDDQTRALVLEQGLAVWLRAPVDVLVERTGRKNTRPLLKTGDPHKILSDLLSARTPAYSQAPIQAHSGLGRLDRTVLSVLTRANSHVFGKGKSKRRRRRR